MKPGDKVTITAPTSRYRGRGGIINVAMAPTLSGENVWEVHIPGAGNFDYKESSLAIDTDELPMGVQAYGAVTMEHEEAPAPIVTLKDAIQAEHNGKKRKTTTYMQRQWKAEGRCPDCGELGQYHLSTPICSRHGAY